MILALVRHGQTNFNLTGLIQGRIDNPLNQNGRKQAYDAASKLKDINLKFNKMAASPLSRALETAFIINNELNIESHIYIDPLFVERDFSYFDGVQVKDAFAEISNSVPSEGYETDEEIIIRVKSAIKKLYNKYKDDNVILCTHSHFIKSVLIMIDNNKYDFFNFLLENGNIVLVKVSKDNITLLDFIK